jgi:hypothetical protein
VKPTRFGWILIVLLLAVLPMLTRNLLQPSAAEALSSQDGQITLLETVAVGTPDPKAYPLPTATCPPPDTPEPLWVDPVDSPTHLRYQLLTVYLGRGRKVTVASSAGTGSVTGLIDSWANPAHVAVPLEPNATNYLTVTGIVEYFPGCTYTLETSRDRHGDPLIIVHRDVASTGLYLPLVQKELRVSR